MSPMLLLAPIGVALLVLVIYLLGGRGTASFKDEAAALARLQQDFFDYAPAECLLDQAEGTSALFIAEHGYDDKIALVTAMGSDFITRMISAGDVKELAQDGALLAFDLNEFTGRRVEITAAPERAQQWYARLEKLEA
ncbi:MAG: hypothetical protein ACPG06_04840 [Alphaproteobacteria bacterium]